MVSHNGTSPRCFGMRRGGRFWAVIAVIFAVALLFGGVSVTIFGVRYTYVVRTVALGGGLLGAIAGAVGSFAVLRKQSLLGDALSHAALPGVAIAFLVSGRQITALLIGAAVAGYLGVGFIRLVTTHTRIKEDGAMGITLTGWFAAGVVGLTYIQSRPDASQAGLDTFIFGQAASIMRGDLYLLAVVGVVVALLMVLFWKQLTVITFDPTFAGANGFSIRGWNALLSALLVVAVVTGLQLAGVVLMVGMVIAPGVAARQWTDRFGQMVILSALFGALSGGIGAILSAVDANLPTGPMIIVTAFTIVAISITCAPRRGVIAMLLSRRRDRVMALSKGPRNGEPHVRS